MTANAASPQPALPAHPVALHRVTFLPSAAREESVLLRLEDPRPTDVVVETLSSESFNQLAGTELRPEELLVLFISDKAIDRESWQRKAEEWMDGDSLAARANLDSGWLLWRPGRAIVLAPPDRAVELLAAVAEFAFYEGQLRQTEREVSAQWESLRLDTPLVHEVGRKDLRRAPHVKQMTAALMDWRLRTARIERRVLSPGTNLSPAGRRGGDKLRTLAEMEDRLETLDGHLEVYEYTYEMINQRISEFRHHLGSLIAEIIIIALLLAEGLMIAWEIWHY